MALVSVGFGFVLFEMVRPYKIVEFENLEVPAVVYREQEAAYINHFCKFREITVNIIVTVEDGRTYQLFSLINNVSPGCVDNVRAFTIPEYLPPGIYRIHFTAVYHPNPFRTIVKEVYSNEFELK